MSNPITDAQIRELRDSKEWPALWLREFALALGEIRSVNDPDVTAQEARTRCAKLVRFAVKAARLRAAVNAEEAK